ncbi:MAG: hypothetical protein A3C06_02325 [Candidatus Taylorbacteria bacterium RIFCSPHIGHO2_02_FULL_46_13]|uniref:Addiction module toxin, HicA family n=1 Tax=Candidatus Taylorbacteria bacterium RIFCSPHIGHO2_02_FULL_46_13 TaxID=1802312 RepID=A0A1G2MSI6_9BACT|nr:MAG: hypothetical protein A3C06_02325 [Candidatus Taylorbacteria bacterium RIFCSPHIGHO2_02_FULL_46_13]
MARLPRVSGKKIIVVLIRRGFYIHHQTGSHVNLRHETKVHLRIVVPSHSRELAPKTIKTIIIQAEMTVEQFLELL